MGLQYNGTDVQGVNYNSNAVKYVIKDGKLVFADPNVYLQSDGSAYIDTGVKPSDDFNTEIVALTKQKALLGCLTTSSNCFVLAASYGEIFAKLWESSASSAGYYTTKKTITTQGNLIYINGILKHTGGTPSNINENLYLFCRNDNGSAIAFSSDNKIYSCKLYYANTILRHFVPVPSGMEIGNITISENCLFDMVTQTPYYNAGSGSFTIGQDA